MDTPCIQAEKPAVTIEVIKAFRDITMDQSLLTAASSIGFPAVIALYTLTRVNVSHRLTTVINRLDASLRERLIKGC